MQILSTDNRYVAPSRIPHAGRGVFAGRTFRKGEVIETCPILAVPDYESEHVSESFLVEYLFYLGENKDRAVLLLGFGSLYNHSDHPNAYYLERPEDDAMDIIALTDIEQDEEIVFHYNPHGNSAAPLWFQS